LSTRSSGSTGGRQTIPIRERRSHERAGPRPQGLTGQAVCTDDFVADAVAVGEDYSPTASAKSRTVTVSPPVGSGRASR